MPWQSSEVQEVWSRLATILGPDHRACVAVETLLRDLDQRLIDLDRGPAGPLDLGPDWSDLGSGLGGSQ